MSADWQQRFRKLRHGMSYDQMVGVVGEPDHSSATEKEIHTYRPAPGVEVTVVMQPSIAGVHAYQNGAYIDLV